MDGGAAEGPLGGGAAEGPLAQVRSSWPTPCIPASILWESSFVAFDARPHAGSE